MKMYTVRYVFGSTILAAHFATIGSFFYFVAAGFLDVFDAMQSASIITPVAGFYLLAFMRYVVANPQGAKDDLEKMNVAPFAVQLALILGFSGTLIFGIWYIILYVPISPEQLPTFTGAVETLFGAYMGLIFKNLFPTG